MMFRIPPTSRQLRLTRHSLRDGHGHTARRIRVTYLQRHRRGADGLEISGTAIETMGLRMHVAEGQRLWALNTPRVPEGIDEAKVRMYLLEERGIEIAGGLGRVRSVGRADLPHRHHGARLDRGECAADLAGVGDGSQDAGLPAGDGVAAAEHALSGARPAVAK